MSSWRSLRARFDALSGPLRGAAWMMMAALCLSGMAASVRVLSSDLHTFEIVFFRTMLGLPFMAPWLIGTGLSGLRTRRLGSLALRGVLTMIAASCFFWSIKLIPLTDAMVALFTRPIFATILAMIVLHEIVSGRRWIAMIAGFTGVLIMVRPGMGGFDIGIVLALVGATFAGAAAVLVRSIARTEPPDTITIYYSIFMTAFSIVPALIVWHTPTWEQAGWILLMGFLGTLGQRALARAFSAAEISVVLPFDYLRLPFAAALGFALFAEEPVIWTWIGGTVIFASTVYLARGEATSRNDTGGRKASSAT